MNSILNKLAKINRCWLISPALRKRLTNRDFSLISSNCNGVYILNDLGLKFMTPTINLSIKPYDFVKFIGDLDFYLEQKIEPIENMGCAYPVGRLYDIEIHFVHYLSIDEACSLWKIRCERINRDKLFFMMTDSDSCTDEDIELFDKLPLENKVIFTHKEYPMYKSTSFVKGRKNEPEYLCYDIFGHRYYDSFNYVSWFNGTLPKQP